MYKPKQFWGMLDIVSRELLEESNSLGLTGNMKQYQRADHIHSFTNESWLRTTAS